MILPQELESKWAIPTLRSMVVKRLIENRSMTQQEVAKKLGITQPAVSHYARNLKGVGSLASSTKGLSLDRVEVLAFVDKIESLLMQENVDKLEVMAQFNEASGYMKRNMMLCDLHRKLDPDPQLLTCEICKE
ncbi:MAG: helix-turn-helix domain-containing protein [Nitrososphaerales archaeon]